MSNVINASMEGMQGHYSLSVLVPVFNEAERLSEVIDFLMSVDCCIDREWIFIDDGSTDGSSEVLNAKAQEYNFKVLTNKKRRGKGYSLRRAISESRGDFIVFQDADFEYDPRDINILLQPLLEGRVDAVYGSRFKQGSIHVHRTFHFFVNRFLTEVSNLCSGIYLTDMETCYKVFRSDLLKSMNLRSNRFELEVEVTAYLAKLRLRLAEIPISYYPRKRLQGKKITWIDGLIALYSIFFFNLFVSKNRAYRNSYETMEMFKPQA